MRPKVGFDLLLMLLQLALGSIEIQHFELLNSTRFILPEITDQSRFTDPHNRGDITM